MRTASILRRILACSLSFLSLQAYAASEPDLYDKAVSSTARPEADRKRDALDQPAALLRLAGIKPGMQVADLMAADGYYTELLSRIVGTKGHVLMLNNAALRRLESRLAEAHRRTIGCPMSSTGRWISITWISPPARSMPC